VNITIYHAEFDRASKGSEGGVGTVVKGELMMDVVEDGWKKARERQLCLKLSRNRFRTSVF
jgi:hypothetical protein